MNKPTAVVALALVSVSVASAENWSRLPSVPSTGAGPSAWHCAHVTSVGMPEARDANAYIASWLISLIKFPRWPFSLPFRPV